MHDIHTDGKQHELKASELYKKDNDIDLPPNVVSPR